MKINPLELFAFLERETGPKDIRVFEGDQFLFASFDDGREQIVHISAISKANLVQYLEDFGEWPGIPAAE